MSLKINLLPEYVRLQRVFKRVIAICLSIFVAVGVLLFLLYYKKGQELKVVKADLEAIEPTAKEAEATKSEAAAIESSSLPKRGAIDFVTSASRTGPERAALLDLISQYVYGGAVISSLDISDGQTVNIKATVKDPDEYARLLNNMRRGSDTKGALVPVFTGPVTGSGVPGFPPPRPGDNNQQGGAQPGAAGAPGQPGAPGQQASPISVTQPQIIVYPVPIDLTAKLKNPVALPPDPVGAAPAAGGGVGGPPGAPGGGAPPVAPAAPAPVAPAPVAPAPATP